jgi:hypothetical protein
LIEFFLGIVGIAVIVVIFAGINAFCDWLVDDDDQTLKR